MAYMKKYMLIVAALAMLVSGCCNKDASTGSASNCSNENTKEETTMNTTMQDLLTRRSIRSYTDQVPPREVIEEICEAGTYAPTGMNRQAPIIVAVTMIFTTVTALNLMHKTALETGKAPVFAECFDNPYLGLSSVYFKIAGDETKLKAVTEELESLNHYTASNGIVSVAVATNAAQTNAL